MMHRGISAVYRVSATWSRRRLAILIDRILNCAFLVCIASFVLIFTSKAPATFPRFVC
jgi:hypothetical protein